MITNPLLWGIFLLPVRVWAYALPEPCSGICTNTHDPSIIRRPDGTYFRFSTGGKIAIHTAPSLNGPWTYKGAAIPRGSSINLPGNQDLWAPELSRSNSTYHLFYSVSTFGSQTSAIGLATSPSLDFNTWTDLGSINLASSPASSAPYNAIDPSIIYDPKQGSKPYLTFGSWWRGIHIIPLDPSGSSFAAPPSSSSAIQLAFDPSDPATEGASVYFRREDGYFYLFFSKGTCCGYDRSRPQRGKEYKILVCRASSVTGPYADRSGRDCRSGGGTVVLESHGWVYGPGGQGVFEDGINGSPVIYYHYVDTRVGYADGQKRFGWNWLRFEAGWPVV
ncbi:glycosyl hydrolase [Cladorrhinum sp. PSN332]|nr:glycosyl hydrolase [Cladorrhinum sp. PSN332]